MYYIKNSTACHHEYSDFHELTTELTKQTAVELLTADARQPSHAVVEALQIDKKVKRSRVKSAYRDAKFRPLFRALQALEEAKRIGGTSVTYAFPSPTTYRLPHTHYSRITLTDQTTPPIDPSFIPEILTDLEEVRDARFWSQYSVDLPFLRRHRVPAPWRDLSDPFRLEWFHHALRLNGGTVGFTLNLSDEVASKAREQKSSAGWIAKRIARELKVATGRKIPFFFTLELSSKRKLHLHGELQVAEHELEASRRALRRAAGEWEHTRQHQAKTKLEPSVVWSNYCAKDWPFMREHRLNHSRPINGDWFFATNETRATAQEIYNRLRPCVADLIHMLPSGTDNHAVDRPSRARRDPPARATSV